MNLKIHAFPNSPRGFKVLAAANYLELDYEFQFVDLGKGDQKKPEFLALNPNGRMPVLEEEGFVLWEPNAILQYLASKKPETGMLPGNARGHADVTRWMFWDASHWDPTCAIFIFEHVVKAFLKMGAPDAAEVTKGEQRFHQFAPVLESQLKAHKFVSGDQPTVADFSLASPLYYAEQAKLPLTPYAAIPRWYKDMSSLPAWKETLGLILPAAA
ncbi:MAG: glutathione S-transferase family protein [Alphaproteobacteria bacterium]|nr:glutathione S-transferase family protein [Alphaproteobacteria bacterium]MDE2111076.1 glutathione S-transferase family protein [Alphaproteobacteria bacterium]MDE2494776.1 glutathione S-transferase family protein [Alphaproteobacteria bacterium]